jgi:nitroimidazol reductase NimA-like FMN-containing flavoprotein (pyridoxamine 5'-phosphate oxidase superfamily)
MPVSYRGPWSAEQVEAYLQRSVYPLRLACVAADGFPRVVAVWFQYASGCFYCVSHRGSKLVALLQANERVGFEVSPNEPPYCGVRGQGVTRLDDLGSNATLDNLLERYLGGADSRLGNWLLSRRDEEMLITLEPSRIFSWDYQERMEDIVAPAGA